jgi:uroporphyrinogen decarboxylase
MARPYPITHRDRLAAALEGRIIDRPPFAVWRHFPGEDQHAETLAAATVRFQELSRSDFVKLMPTGMYAVQDYGVKVRTSPDDIGTTRFADGPISSPSDWKQLRSADPTKGMLGDQLRVIRMVRESLGPDVPILQTIFSPLSIAAKLAGSRALLFASLASLRHELGDALHRLSDDVESFAVACLDAGADGFFFATQFADRDMFPESDTGSGGCRSISR